MACGQGQGYVGRDERAIGDIRRASESSSIGRHLQLHNTSISIFAVHAFMASDSMPLIFGLTVRSYTQWLTERVERLRINPKRNEDENYQELVQCIKDHQLIVEYSENMRPLISIALFVQYTTASLVMASSLVHLVTFADMVSGVTTTIYMISCMFQTFPISYICEQIVEDCELLSRAIFHSNWIGAPTAYTSALKYFIHRTQQPIQFIAGGVFLICLNVNIQVAKFAFSLTTFVQQMSVFENFDR
ncbi:odorant receptor 85a isoform X3 [Drosophila mojavensis]|uniref:odorant receptor 85a isoform X3 n=1 Tax=Drosophila mojavensis TaxID=7230 RepID=UPI001CD1603A|nr:odorant receptor 85a isoform X3 [Drosophila mojavensis]